MDRQHEKQPIYLGNGWEGQYGITVSLKLSALKDALTNGDLVPNDYGEVRIQVNRMREVNPKSKATHSVKPYIVKERKEKKVEDDFPF